jgi:hypothetical protein
MPVLRKAAKNSCRTPGARVRLTLPSTSAILDTMSELVQSAKMDKTVFSVASLGEEPNDLAYWLSKTVEERWAAIELLRQIHYGYDPATARLQRVYQVLELGEG